MSDLLASQAALIASMDQAISELRALLKSRGVHPLALRYPREKSRHKSHEAEQMAAIHRRRLILRTLRMQIDMVLPTRKQERAA